jgi:phenylpropionate dioxygenase-like ring-hydroxylating dioxygenase large terminal subunit
MKQLQGVPWLLAHRSMLKPNKPMKISLFGSDYVIWQDSHGKIAALPNACPHMGAMLSEGWCVLKPDGSSTVACPFHALEFDQVGCTVSCSSFKPYCQELQNPCSATILVATDTQFKCVTAYCPVLIRQRSHCSNR